jgi:hypothetical protein
LTKVERPENKNGKEEMFMKTRQLDEIISRLPVPEIKDGDTDKVMNYTETRDFEIKLASDISIEDKNLIDPKDLIDKDNVDDWIKEVKSSNGTSGFFAAVSRYYAQFLDTDFKKTRLPKRRLETKDKKNRRKGVPLKKYPGFESKVWSGIQKTNGDGYRFSITKDTYVATLPATTLKAVNSQIKKLSYDEITKDLEVLQNRFLEKVRSKPDPEIFRDQFLEELRIILVRKIVAPLLEQLDARFDSESSPVERLVELEDELSNYLTGPIAEDSS